MVSAGEQTGLSGIESAAEVEADRAAREDDPTPRDLVGHVLVWGVGPLMGEDACDREGLDEPPGAPGRRLTFNAKPWRWVDEQRPLRVLDVCAGWGSWSSEMRRLAFLMGWPVHITGVEIDERKRPHLEKWCDVALFGDWLASIAGHEFDLVIGNPHFSALTHEYPAQSMPAVLLRYAPAVLLFHQMASFTRSIAGRDTWRAYPPAWIGMVPGSVGFRGRSRGADLRSYQATLWLRGHEGPAETVLLPEPPMRAKKGKLSRSSSWHWDVPPGTEEPSAEMPAVPGWSGVRPG